MQTPSVTTDSGPSAVVEALIDAVSRFPDLPPRPARFADLPPREVALATMIHRTAMRRWITLEYMLNRSLRRPIATLEPKVRAVLMAGATQILFLHGRPVHAVVNESVQIARKWVRPGAGGLVNAVLRRLSEQVVGIVPGQRWSPRADRLPGDGVTIQLRDPCLPDPGETDQERTDDNRLIEYLSVAVSLPRELVRRRIKRFGVEQAIEICRHAVLTPPILVAVESGWRDACEPDRTTDTIPHQLPGYVAWKGSNQGLRQFLSGDDERRVQDPGSGVPVRCTRGLHPGVIVDYCAGNGTKTRQLLGSHPQARIIAFEVSQDRRATLRKSFENDPRVRVEAVDNGRPVSGTDLADLLVLDVPCSNTGVLARRPEARYRFGDDSMKSLINLQREIIVKAMRWVASDGHILYCTCSLEEEENESQVRWMTSRFPVVVLEESLTTPSGTTSGETSGGGETYHDGGYYVLLRMNASSDPLA